jgi:hypothetical protein
MIVVKGRTPVHQTPSKPVFTIPNEPRIITEAQLRTILGAILGLDRWAQDTIGDLWRMGAPAPSYGTEEARILLPNQFRTWWNDVMGRLGGRPLP